MDFVNEVGARSVIDSVTLSNWIPEDVALSAGFTATVWEKKIAIHGQDMLPDVKTSSTVRSYPPLVTARTNKNVFLFSVDHG